jgi:hypothetical protein
MTDERPSGGVVPSNGRLTTTSPVRWIASNVALIVVIYIHHDQTDTDTPQDWVFSKERPY